MSNLSLKLSGADSTSGAPVYVEVINTELETVAELPILVNSSREIQLEPGKYLIRANLPSGKTISTKAFVTEKPNEVELSFIQSPVQQLEWQDFLGNTSTRTDALKISQFTSTWQRLWSREQQTWKVPEWHSKWKQPRDETAIKFPLELPQNQLQFLQVGGLQIPWHLIALPPGKDLQVLVRPSEYESAFGEDITLAVTSRNNQEAETLLSYLNSGNIRAAKVVGEEFVEKSLRKRFLNPLEAVIGGYYLLKVNTNERLDEWCRKFITQEKWLPDAHLILAWQLLREPEVRINSARSCLLTTVKCGIPIYTQGLRLLFDGLQIFHQNEQNEEIEQALKKIRGYAAAADWSKSLTTFYGHDPEHPEYARITGIPQDTRGLVWLSEPAIAPEQQSDNSPQGILVTLSQWLQNNFDEALQAGYQTVEEIFGSTSLAFRGTSTIKLAKLINLGSGCVVALIVEVNQALEDKIDIVLWVFPYNGQTYLPENLTVAYISGSGEPPKEGRAGSGQLRMRLRLNHRLGERFDFQLTLGDISVTESFVI